VSVKAADVLPASAIPRPAAEAPKTKEPLYRRARKVLNGKTDHNAVYDGASGDLDAVSREAVAAHEAAPKAPAENPISKESVTIRDKDIERRTRNVVKSLRGGYLSRQTVANLREELRAVRKTYLSDELPEPGYRRAERLIRRAEGEIARKFITRAVATLELALEDIEHKTSYRATIRVRTKKDSRSRADVSYRYFVKGTRLKTMVKRLKSEGEVLWARIGRGEWVRYDHLRLDLRLRKDLVLDLVFR
jgi:hypothetical protein